MNQQISLDFLALGRSHGLTATQAEWLWRRLAADPQYEVAPHPDRWLRAAFARAAAALGAEARRGSDEAEVVPGRTSARSITSLPPGYSAIPDREFGVRSPVIGKRTLVEDLMVASPAVPSGRPFFAEVQALLGAHRPQVSATAGTATDGGGATGGKANDAAPVPDERALFEIAASGVEGPGEPYPFLDQIQVSFGAHDLSGLRAHTGNRAAAASRKLGGIAYAFGDRVAFDGTPTLHTAAHEATHFLQQRAGHKAKGGIDTPGDRHESQANEVAAAVVAGRPAGHLLAFMASGGGGAQASVQRQTAPPGTAGPTGPTTSPGPTAASAPTVVPPSRTADWPQVSAAGNDRDAKQQLDIEWIDQLPDYLRHTIDVAFADNKADAAVTRKAKSDAKMKQADTAYAKAKAALRRATAERLQVKPSSPKIDQDPDYVTQERKLAATRDQEKAARMAELEQNHDASMPAGQRKQSVTQPPDRTVKRLEGRALARTNFMSWAIHVTGSAEAAKRHYSSMREVRGEPGMWLAGEAASRFEAARADFESRHPGYTFPSTDVAQSMRAAHQERNGVGMLGHALGVAFDFWAADNPNLKGASNEPTGLNSYMLGTFGADPTTGKKGRTIMDLGKAGDAKIEAAGKHAMAGKRTVDDDAIVNNIRAQFDEIATTSERFKASLAPHLPRLQELRDLYFNQPALKSKVTEIDNKIRILDKLATAKLAEEKFAPDEALSKQEQAQQKAERLAAIKQEIGRSLRVERSNAKEQFDASEIEVPQGLEEVFSTWINTLTAQLAASKANQTKLQADANAASDAMATLKRLYKPDDIDAFATEHGLPPRSGKGYDYKKLLTAELQSKKNKATDAATYAKNESTVYIELIEKLANPKKVFGTGVHDADQHWHTKREASEVSIMQLAEGGFIRNDAMPDLEPGQRNNGRRKQVFNAEVAATLARFGWSPGSTFGDTMHFDFVEGYTNAVPGGRSQANLKRTRFSPEGDYTPPPAKTKSPSK